MRDGNKKTDMWIQQRMRMRKQRGKRKRSKVNPQVSQSGGSFSVPQQSLLAACWEAKLNGLSGHWILDQAGDLVEPGGKQLICAQALWQTSHSGKEPLRVSRT